MAMKARGLIVLHLVLVAACATRIAAHTDTWAVIVSSSRFWLNYRHTSNALSIYQEVKRCVAAPIRPAIPTHLPCTPSAPRRCLPYSLSPLPLLQAGRPRCPHPADAGRLQRV